MSTLFDNRDPEKQAIRLLEQLPLLERWSRPQPDYRDGDRRAFIIEFGGMPKAGKSTVIENVRHFFSHGPKIYPDQHFARKWKLSAGYKVHTPAEGVSMRTPTYLKSDKVDFNVWAGAYAVQQLLQARHDRYNDLAILDRGPWDAGCWLEYYQNSKADNTEELVRFFQLPRWMTQSDLHVVLVVDPDVAAERERMSRLIAHSGPASNLPLMRDMRKIYEQHFEILKGEKVAACPHVGPKSALLIDTTKLHQKDVALQVIEAAFEVLRAKVDLRGTDSVGVPTVKLTIKDVDAVANRLLGKLSATQRKVLAPRLKELTEYAVARGVRRDRLLAEAERLVPQQAPINFNRAKPDTIFADLRALIDRAAQ